MKTICLFVLLITGTSSLQAQSLKEALYGKKLKADTGAVLRKGEAEKIKENMEQKAVEDETKKAEAEIKRAADSASAIANAAAKAVADSTDRANGVPPPPNPEVVIKKDNDKLWKEFVDSLNTSFKLEVLPSKKIKSGNYTLLLDYEIGLDGQLSVNSAVADPKNDYLEEQVKKWITYNAPKMNPVISNGKPRVAKKKQLFSFVKD